MTLQEELEARAREAREARLALIASPRGAVEHTDVSWAGVWSGFLTALGVLILLSALGGAIGVTVADARAPASAALAVRVRLIWAFSSLIIASFVGGLVAARWGMVGSRSSGAIHGTLVWVLSTVGIILLAAAGVTLASNVFFGGFGGRAVTPVAPSLVGVAPAVAADLATGNLDQLVVDLSDPLTADAITRATGRTRPEVDATLAVTRQRIEASRAEPAAALTAARQGLEALVTGTPVAAVDRHAAITSWVTFGVMVATLLVAIAGGLAGAARVAAMRPVY